MNDTISNCYSLENIVRHCITKALILIMIILVSSESAHAYIGPGAGVTMLGALWGVILAIVFAVGGLLIWPIRALMHRRKQTKSIEKDSDSAD